MATIPLPLADVSSLNLKTILFFYTEPVTDNELTVEKILGNSFGSSRVSSLQFFRSQVIKTSIAIALGCHRFPTWYLTPDTERLCFCFGFSISSRNSPSHALGNFLYSFQGGHGSAVYRLSCFFMFIS